MSKEFYASLSMKLPDAAFSPSTEGELAVSRMSAQAAVRIFNDALAKAEKAAEDPNCDETKKMQTLGALMHFGAELRSVMKDISVIAATTNTIRKHEGMWEIKEVQKLVADIFSLISGFLSDDQLDFVKERIAHRIQTMGEDNRTSLVPVEMVTAAMDQAVLGEAMPEGMTATKLRLVN